MELGLSITSGDGLPVQYVGIGQLLDANGQTFIEERYTQRLWPIAGYSNDAQGCHDWCGGYSDQYNIAGFSFYGGDGLGDDTTQLPHDIDEGCWCYLRSEENVGVGGIKPVPNYGHAYCFGCLSEIPETDTPSFQRFGSPHTGSTIESPSTVSPHQPFLFDGIEGADSVHLGFIHLTWDFPTYANGDIVDDLSSVKYHIMSSVGHYDFSAFLANATAEELVSDFESNSLTNEYMQYHLVHDGEAFEHSLHTEFHGELHTLFVLAEVEGVLSSNTEDTELVASELEPMLNDNINLVGVFIPTTRLNVTLSADNSVLEFDGPVRQEHKNLSSGDYVLGFTSELQVFCLQVIEVMLTSDMRVVLSTEQATVEAIYKSIDYEASVGLSRPNKVKVSPTSGHRHRHLIARKHLRRLGFFDDLVDAVTDAVEWIGDAVETVVDAISDVAQSIVSVFTTGEMSGSLNLVNFDRPIDWKAGSSQVKGNVNARSDVYVSIKVTPIRSPYFKAETGWRADYSADFDVVFSGPQGLINKEMNIWRGSEQFKTFFVGVVPVVLSARPKLDAKFTVQVSGGAKMKIGGKGKARIGARADASPAIAVDYDAPSFDPYFYFDVDKVALTAEIYVIPKVEVNLYLGVLRGELGIGIGPSISTEIDVTAIVAGDQAVETLDIDMNVYGEVNIGSVFTEQKKVAKLFERSFPVDSLNTNFAEQPGSNGNGNDNGGNGNGGNNTGTKSSKNGSSDNNGTKSSKNGSNGNTKSSKNGSNDNGSNGTKSSKNESKGGKSKSSKGPKQGKSKSSKDKPSKDKPSKSKSSKGKSSKGNGKGKSPKKSEKKKKNLFNRRLTRRVNGGWHTSFHRRQI